jgi:hypothetical protein
MDIVLDFVKKLDDFHEYSVYADSWYDSEELALQLHKSGFWFTIACKSNKPSYLFSQYLHLGLKKHCFRAASRELEPEIIALSFYDNKICNFLSNQFGTETIQTDSNDIISAIISDYRKFKGGGDMGDSNHL